MSPGKPAPVASPTRPMATACEVGDRYASPAAKVHAGSFTDNFRPLARVRVAGLSDPTGRSKQKRVPSASKSQLPRPGGDGGGHAEPGPRTVLVPWSRSMMRTG